ncbi:MAG: radical SAM family heme chaperone HemW [Chloroflexota bacterium]
MVRENFERRNHSIYISIPFCHHICSYCDLNAYAGLNHLMPRYVKALVKEIQTLTPNPSPIRNVTEWERGVVSTVYFGGGTPSIVPIESLKEIFSALRDSFSLTADPEISFEANPEDSTPQYLAGLRALGVNRLSFGVQSANANELTLFNRSHTFDDARQAIHNARVVGFKNVSVDLIFGIPQQTMISWQDTLKRTLDLAPNHFSIYSLSLDFGTPMRAWVLRGLLPEPDSDLAADMYEWGDEELMRHGFEQYEVSSWAKSSDQSSVNGDQFECKHNLQYWHNDPYFGLGAGAHGYIYGQRYSNVMSPTAYINRMDGSPKSPTSGKVEDFAFHSPTMNGSIPVDRKTEMDETMLTGMRLTKEGVSFERFRKRFGVEIGDVFAKELKELEERKLVEVDDERVRLTKGGRLVANWVFEKFV